MIELLEQFKAVNAQCQYLANMDEPLRIQILKSLSKALIDDQFKIIEANEQDLARMDITDPKYDRLKLDSPRIENMAREVENVATLISPLGRILSQTTRPNGLLLKKISVPIGVVGVIYESRPNVTIDVFSLCFKSGNACILKGGKEAEQTNRILIDIIHQVLKNYSISTDSVYLMPSNREATTTLLEAVGFVDVCIPRGSQNLIDYVRNHAKIPVIETGAGIVHIYFDSEGNTEKGKNIIFNAKTRRVSVCNALDTLIIHQKRLLDLPELVLECAKKGVEIYADEQSFNVLSVHYPENLLHHASVEDFGREFLDYKMAIKTVESLDEAINHISHYSSKHSEAIITENQEHCERFMKFIDAAAVYVNASTSFSDGGEFGLGAEIGISTQKLHARGPMGLEALTSYKWFIYGEGQVRA